MAKAGQMPYADALAAIAVEKRWSGGRKIKWRPQGKNGFPDSHKARVNLSINGVIQEGYFLDLFHKESTLDGVPDKISFVFVVSGARIVALDENGPSVHLNVAGKGMEHYQKRVDHPHIHVPVEESSSGYAEPIRRVEIERLWRVFLERANIKSAPPFNFPSESGQMELL
ncbi:hypothetical protein [Pseudomonas sp. R5(2019)]|uniref:hypothetical protein n=1 Tax=Pseudomonas sp. R5(2019) TaxID=2697566 RepID=UPI0014130509|nr:hypothetical protein [Pseudomonas sp. R5(2019)]NBA95533.1 hypothetical protein [Pseudomonas sp. R5(2019)]